MQPLGDENRIAVFQTPQRRRAQNRRAQVALVARKQDGKRGEANGIGHDPADHAEGLRVGDNERRRLAQQAERACELGLACDNRNTACVEQ